MNQSDTKRKCPQCNWLIQAVDTQTEDPNWKHFYCETCAEDWYENIKYCIPEEVEPELQLATL